MYGPIATSVQVQDRLPSAARYPNNRRICNMQFHRVSTVCAGGDNNSALCVHVMLGSDYLDYSEMVDWHRWQGLSFSDTGHIYRQDIAESDPSSRD